MFNTLSEKIDRAFKRLRGKTVISDEDLSSVLKEVKFALLEADVNFKVVKKFCEEVANEARGEQVQKSLTPEKQILSIIQKKLTEIMGESDESLNLKGQIPVVILLVGLQGSGKTTTAGKLALYLRSKKNRRPLLVPADIYRPAAIDQLKKIGKQINIPVYQTDPTIPPQETAKKAISYAKEHSFDTVILDTAGRLQIDKKLMEELKEMQEIVNPAEILLVADSMTGQEAVNVAKGFNEALDLSGIILTKLDGDARGGAALSMKTVTGKPIKFVGVGEKFSALEAFYPDRMASRILGMGDILSLVEKTSQAASIEESLELEKKIKKNQFTLEDFLKQLRTIKKMGSFSSLLGMIPGISKFAQKIDSDQAEKELKKVEAIILSMTAEERKHPEIIKASRKKRIAKGSGTTVQDINNLLNRFNQMKKMMKQLTKGGLKGLSKMFGG